MVPNTARIKQRAEPRAGKILLRMQRVGICGTDYHIFDGSQPFFTYLRCIGDELAGEMCQRGRPNCCARISVLAVHADGGMTEHLVIPIGAVIASPHCSTCP